MLRAALKKIVMFVALVSIAELVLLLVLTHSTQHTTNSTVELTGTELSNTEK
jgi:hypothetical protein